MITTIIEKISEICYIELCKGGVSELAPPTFLGGVKSIVMGYVYILQSIKNGRYYTGSTVDIDTRVQHHNSGYGSIYTSIHKPWRLVCYKKCNTIGDARIEEKKVKSYKGGNAFKKIINGGVSEWSIVPLC
ncbi:MAG: GIY-YIG nuclease family protein [Candidatus Taylorbacteria bacterium]|nr:GIY-YIG nuclease family protein [Candidatus Taylorbacteria bacterium]